VVNVVVKPQPEPTSTPVVVQPTPAAPTTDSDHNDQIFPNLARDKIFDAPNQHWILADITLQHRYC
jgi:hypothetical protein